MLFRDETEEQTIDRILQELGIRVPEVDMEDQDIPAYTTETILAENLPPETLSGWWFRPCA
jgi:hypothetical protein